MLLSVKEHKGDLEALGPLSSRLRVTCSAVRANLETHVRSEETELWPLFNEHFTISEQEQIVGSIVGHTGSRSCLLAFKPTYQLYHRHSVRNALALTAGRFVMRHYRCGGPADHDILGGKGDQPGGAGGHDGRTALCDAQHSV